MVSTTISIVGLLMVAVGGTLVYWQSLGRRKFETVVAGLGVALIACGLAVVRDGMSGSRDILWMLPAVNAASAPTN